ncbi:MAG: PH domain-containing protein [Planctomycetota bacterium]
MSVPLFAAMILYLVWMWSEWRNIKYTLTSRTITFEYGTFSRTIKSIELWRIRQMVYHGGVLESLLGIGRIHVESKELTGTFSKIGPIFRAHQIYKSLDGARQVAIRERGVMAVES